MATGDNTTLATPTGYTGPTDGEIDNALKLSIYAYDPKEKYPEWSNDDLRAAYRAGWEDGRNG